MDIYTEIDTSCAKDPDPDPLDPQDFGFLDLDPQKYADPRIRIQKGKILTKNCKKKIYSQNPNLNYWKKRDYKNWRISGFN